MPGIGEMPEIAIGRKEIMKVLHVGSWRTVSRNRKSDPGFNNLFRWSPINKKPFIIYSEYVEYLIEWNKKTQNKK